MDPLIPKLVVTAVLIATASHIQRRWGHSVGGLVASLPLTSGPLLLYLALDHGADYAATAAGTSFVELLSFTGYALSYAWLARRHRWPLSLAGAITCFLCCATTLLTLALPVYLTALLIVPVVLLALHGWPRSTVDSLPRRTSWSRWDLPLRVLIAVAVTAGVTEGAPVLGAHLAGMLAMFPMLSCVLSASTHHRAGGAAASRFLRSVVTGLVACTGFFLVLVTTLHPLGVLLGFGLALAVLLLIQVFGAGRIDRLLPGRAVSRRHSPAW